MNFSKQQFSHTVQQHIILGFLKIKFLNEKINNVFISLKRGYFLSVLQGLYNTISENPKAKVKRQKQLVQILLVKNKTNLIFHAINEFCWRFAFL